MDISIYYKDYSINLRIKQSSTICFCSVESKVAVEDFSNERFLTILKRNKITNGLDYRNISRCCEAIRKGKDLKNIIVAQGRLPAYSRKNIKLVISEIVKTSTSNNAYFGKVKEGQVLATFNDNNKSLLDGYTIEGEPLSAHQYFENLAGSGVQIDFDKRVLKAKCDGYAYMKSDVLTVNKNYQNIAKENESKVCQTNFLLLLSDFIDTQAALN